MSVNEFTQAQRSMLLERIVRNPTHILPDMRLLLAQVEPCRRVPSPCAGTFYFFHVVFIVSPHKNSCPVDIDRFYSDLHDPDNTLADVIKGDKVETWFSNFGY